jgi:hypothetical protein
VQKAPDVLPAIKAGINRRRVPDLLLRERTLLLGERSRMVDALA